MTSNYNYERVNNSIHNQDTRLYIRQKPVQPVVPPYGHVII